MAPTAASLLDAGTLTNGGHRLWLALVSAPLWACKPAVVDSLEPPPSVLPAEVQLESEGVPIEKEDFQVCVNMAGGEIACSCEYYQSLLCSGAAPDDESNPPNAVADADICLLGATTPISGEQGAGLLREFVTLDLSNVRSPLNPRGVRTLAELLDQGFSLAFTPGGIEIHSADWTHSVELFEILDPREGELHLARFTSVAHQASYRGARIILVLQESDGEAHAVELREYFVDRCGNEQSQRAPSQLTTSSSSSADAPPAST